MKLPFFRKKTDDTKGKETEATTEASVNEGRVAVAEDARGKVESTTNQSIENRLKEAIKILNEAKGKVSNLTNYEEISRLQEETKESTDRYFYGEGPYTDELCKSLCKEMYEMNDEFYKLLDDKTEEIYGVRIYRAERRGKKILSSYEKLEKTHILDFLEKIGLLGGMYPDDNRINLDMWFGASFKVIVSFANGQSIVFDDPSKDNKLPPALLAQARDISINLQINTDNKE